MSDIWVYVGAAVFALFCAGMVWEYASSRDEHTKFQRWFDSNWGWRLPGGKREPAQIGTQWTTTRVALLVGVALVLVFLVRLAIDLV